MFINAALSTTKASHKTTILFLTVTNLTKKTIHYTCFLLFLPSLPLHLFLMSSIRLTVIRKHKFPTISLQMIFFRDFVRRFGFFFGFTS